MTPRRRQPPLFEALGEPPRRDHAPGAPVVHPGPVAASSNGTHPSAVAPAPRAPVVVEAHPGGSSGRRAGSNRTTVIMFLCAAVIGLGTLVYVLGYNLGHDAGQKSVLSHTDPKEAAAITGQDPNGSAPPGELPPGGTSQTVNRPVQPPIKPAPDNSEKADARIAGAMPPVVQADNRKPGFNYLELCPLTWKDAEPAVRYLQGHGVRATAIPNNRGVDPAKPQPNNPFLIIVDQPYASGNFKASQAERNALVAEVRRLGKAWLSEHRGASDFADPMWRLQRGK